MELIAKGYYSERTFNRIQKNIDLYIGAEMKHLFQLGRGYKPSCISTEIHYGFFLGTKVSTMIHFCVFSVPSEASEPGKL